MKVEALHLRIFKSAFLKLFWIPPVIKEYIIASISMSWTGPGSKGFYQTNVMEGSRKDGISPEIYNYSGLKLVKKLHKLFKLIWRVAYVPQDHKHTPIKHLLIKYFLDSLHCIIKYTVDDNYPKS